MKKTFKSISFAVFYIYFLAFVLIATPYFNWRYARQHGFASWVVFGEIIATAKAAIWPYYAVVSFDSGRSNADTRSDQHYTNSKRACDEALRVVIRFGGVTTLPPKEVSNVAQLLQAAVTEAELVDDAYLERVHPEFRPRYQGDYIGSLRLLADGVRAGDRIKQISATATYNSFSEWMSAHAKELKFP